MSRPTFHPPLVLALPTADRRVAYAFYGDGLGFEAIGEPADDGVPEPLQFEVFAGLRVMLVPKGGFGWITGGREVASEGQSECVLSVAVPDAEAVDAFVDRARAAGAEIVLPPDSHAWGYAAAFADPDGHVWQVMADGS